MEIGQAFTTMNWLGVLLATISAFMIGGVWYGPLFGKAWMRENRFTDQDLQSRNMGRVFAIAIVLSAIAAIVLAMFIGADAGAGFGAIAGFFVGAGWVATMIGVHYVFEMKSFSLFGINAGYSIVALTAMGLIIGMV